ncbi:helix-turn-helix transcriptional regulator [Streptomyces sp. RKAG290]|uniref:helix-turn-helix transcriptional regulator n=1 Tax=Streptomyces sp. RKAG290 TaxID=2888348 RepID=UPI002034265C|nr:helix-turn-helix transcriptional regulator [Streptomyces sp. RKAG290]MCM2414856.1 helix-turn-helix transcriptional regulator [Streptomyces sp. RKAG290]
MAPGHVAYGMYASYGMTHVTADHIINWERGTAHPSASELAALAGALWCAPSQLIGAPRTLREHRLARGLAVEDIARATGLEVHAYLLMESTGEWAGNSRQSAALAAVLTLSPRDFITVTGLNGELAELLHDAVSTRWQAHTRPIARLLSVDRKELSGPLREMHQEYQALMAATLSRAGGSSASGAAGQRYLEEILDHFWSKLPPSQ